MSSWHQRRNPQPLWHPELYTVVTGGYGNPEGVSRFRDPVDAERYVQRVKESGGRAYTLPPAPLPEKA